MDHASGTLVRLNPVADLHDRELEDPPIDHIPCMRPDLDAITGAEGPTRNDEHLSREVRHEILERDREACRQQSEKGAETPDRGEPDKQEYEQSQNQCHVPGDLGPSILDGYVVDTRTRRDEQCPTRQEYERDTENGEQDLDLRVGREARELVPSYTTRKGILLDYGRH
jgi:hypothetical protein